MRTWATFVASTLDAGESGNEGTRVDPSVSLRMIDSVMTSSRADALILSGDATVIRTRIESTERVAAYLSTYARKLTAVASVLRSRSTGFFGRGVRIFSANASFEGYLSTIAGGNLGISATDSVPTSSRCVGCVIRGSTSLKAGATYKTVATAYTQPCAVRYEGTCISQATVVNACDPAWCTEARDNVVGLFAFDEETLEPTLGTSQLPALDDFEALGLPPSAVIDLNGTCRPAGGAAPGALEPR